jgi:hypothetical protein
MKDDVICHRCGSINDYRTEVSGPHLKAICNGCDRYIKFISKKTLPNEQSVNNTVMSILINGSLCLTDLVEQAQKGHSAFNRGKNNKVYVNFTEWVNDEPDAYGNHASIQLNSTKEKRETEGKVYIGNGKRSDTTQSHPVTPQEAAPIAAALDNLPF